VPTERLRGLLHELHRELENTKTLDAEGADLLRGLHSDIETLVDAGPTDPDAGGLVERLRDSVRRFEGSHPGLTAVIQRITDTLAAAGL
jgi:hypothetical protein